MDQRPKTILYQKRQRKGWTQSQLAQKLNNLAEEGEAYGAATTDMIRKWEKGIHTPSPFYLRRLCRLFDCTADQLGFALPEEAQTMVVPSTAPLLPRENIIAARNPKRSWSDTMQQTFSLLQANEQSDTIVEMLRTLLASMPEETATSGMAPISRSQLLEIGIEEALLALPKQWFLRRAMTSIGLAMAYARLGQKHASLTIAKELIPLLKQTNAPLTNQWFTNYLQQDLLAEFHTDDEIQGFIVEECQQLSQQAHLFHQQS
jgi:transcriptional regulator with XRE-family HTH domain